MCESDSAAVRRQNEGGEPSIAAAVITDRGRVLLVRRRVPEGDLDWQFPAGKVEDGETVDEAAVRETAEEAGVDVVNYGAIRQDPAVQIAACQRRASGP